MIKKQLSSPSLALTIFFFGVGVLTILAATPHGLGFAHDSVFYWSAANGLLEGRGITRIGGSGEPVPITHFPPLYPAALAAVAGATRVSVTAAARGLAGALLGLNLALIWLLVQRATGSALVAGVSTGLAYLSPPVLERHLWAMSEPLHFALMLSTTALILSYLKAGSRGALIAAAVTAGLAYLNRYAGLALILSGLVSIVLLRHGPIRRRIQDAAIFAGLGLLPGVLWLARNLRLTGVAANRVIGWHPPGFDQLKEAGASLASWLPVDAIPLQVRAMLVGVVGLAVVWWCLRIIRADPDRPNAHALLPVLGLHAICYGLLLTVSLSVFDASTRLDSRTLSPLFLVGFLAAGVIGGRGAAEGQSRLAHIALAGAVATLAVVYGVRSAATLQVSATDGLGFSSNRWRNSETIGHVTELEPQLLIYSNEALGVYFLSGHPAFSVPEQVDPVKDTLRADFPELYEEMRQQLETGKAVLVLFSPHALPEVLPELEQLTEGLVEATVGPDGTIYQARSE